MTKRRVVVTGLGVVSPVGCTIDSAWNAVLAGKSGVKTIDRFDVSDLTTRIAAVVTDFDSSLAMEPKEARRVDMFIQYAMEATRQAVAHAGLEITEAIAPRAGVAIGSGIGGLPWMEASHDILANSGQRRLSPFFIPGAIINMAPGIISMKYNLQGPNLSIVSACTTGLHNIGHAARMIVYGDADVMIAGGTEMATTRLGIGGFGAARALSTRNDQPTKASRPWDRDRDGFVLAEGAGTVVLEELEFAKARGATILAEVVGFGMSGDAYHMTAPDPDGKGFAMCMQHALNDAKLNKDAIQYINAHATSTMADVVEAAAVKLAFQDHAYKLSVSSTKSITGHMLGAAGAVEAIFSILAIRDQVAPPTINLDNPDEGCDLDFVPHQAKPMKIDAVMSNSFGFGGTNGCIILKRFDA